MAAKRRTFSGEELALLEAIHANPRDDVVRLVYADWLEERGDPLGEFLRLQVAYGGEILGGGGHGYDCRGRRQELYRLHRWDWLRPVPRFLRPLMFLRGLPVLRFRPARLEGLTGAGLEEALRAVNPRVRFAMLCFDTPGLAELLRHRFFARVDVLGVMAGPPPLVGQDGVISPEAVVAVAGCPYVGHFQTVELQCAEPRLGHESREMHALINKHLASGPPVYARVRPALWSAR